MLNTSIFLCVFFHSEQIRRVGNAKLRAVTHARSAGLLGPWLLTQNSIAPHLHFGCKCHFTWSRVWKKCAVTPSVGCGQERRVAATAVSSAPGLFNPKCRRGMWEWGENVSVCRHLSFESFSCCQTGFNQVLRAKQSRTAAAFSAQVSHFSGASPLHLPGCIYQNREGVFLWSVREKLIK